MSYIWLQTIGEAASEAKFFRKVIAGRCVASHGHGVIEP